jgi:hypothetical protein
LVTDYRDIERKSGIEALSKRREGLMRLEKLRGSEKSPGWIN